ncbi:MAG: M43 family zinc metalloprotease [Flavobacteriaceae bacterium]
MKKIVLLLCLLTVSMFFAQERNCSSMENLEYRLQKNPELKQRMNDIEAFTQQRVQQYQTNRVEGDIITIPVVVHVLYRTTAENISTAQIQSQIDVLNEDFRRTNSDANNMWSQAADTQIEFCLTTIDPNGNATTGITRKSTTKTSWGTNDAMKKSSQGGVDPWDTSKYLNIWVCNIGGGILGYAQFPGGSAATDGVVNSPQYFGRTGTATAPFNLGRTATHEVGHFLNLRHIWGDGGCGVDDFVSDTPESDASNGGCATNHTSCGTLDMVQNYMDYSDDSCMNLFTQGQKSRMRSVLEAGGSRRSLALSDKCGAVVVTPTCTDGIQNGDETGVDCGGSSCAPCQTACADNEVTISITFDNYPEETSWTLVNDGGQSVASGTYSKSNADGSTVTETLCLPNDCYTFTINDAYGDGICCSYGNGSYAITGPDGNIKSGGSFGASEATNFCFSNTPAPTCTDGIQNGDETGVDCGGSSCSPCQAVCVDTTLRIKFDNYPEETSWNIKDSSGSIVTSGGTYGSQSDGSILTINNCLPAGCYTLEFKDSYGDGMCCSYGNGNYTLTTTATGTVLASGASFSSTDTNNFCVGNTRTDISDNIDSETTELNLSIFPNPVSGNDLNIITKNNDKSTYKIVNTLGQVLMNGELNDIKSTINVSRLNSGVYFIVVKNNTSNATKQFIKK